MLKTFIGLPGLYTNIIYTISFSFIYILYLFFIYIYNFIYCVLDSFIPYNYNYYLINIIISYNMGFLNTEVFNNCSCGSAIRLIQVSVSCTREYTSVYIFIFLSFLLSHYHFLIKQQL